MRTVFFNGPGSEDEQPPSSGFLIPTPLSPEELRVLGCLLEKQFLTPDVYPLTLNSIVTACNQKTSRDPVVNYDDVTADATLAILQGRGLAAKITGADHRVPKFKELLSEKTGFRVSEIAVLCVMMLRGPQTVNELKERTNRIHTFADADDVEATLDRLMLREPQEVVVRLPKLPGHKEVRYMHLLAGPINIEEMQVASTSAPLPSSAPPREDRIARLETEVLTLKQQVEVLQSQFAEFRKQFE